MTSIAQLRLDFANEMPERLTSASPPIVRTVQDSAGRYEVIEEAEPADANGRNLSAAMVTLIGSITAELSFYPPRYPVRRALAEWERTCRRRHRGGQWWDHAERPLCGELLRAHVEHGVSVLWLSDHFQVSYPRAERLISSGAAFVAERLSRWQDEKLGIAHDREHCAVCREEAG